MNAPLIREAALDVINASEMVRRMAHATFRCWEVVNGLSHPLAVPGETLADVERALCADAFHGRTFLIEETLAVSGKATLHTVRIRRGKAIGWDANAKRTYAYSADRLCSVAVKAFEPTLPWRWSPGADVLGRSNVIDAR
jgi:hypothetical protein